MRVLYAAYLLLKTQMTNLLSILHNSACYPSYPEALDQCEINAKSNG